MSQIGKKNINVPDSISIDIQQGLFTASKGNKKLSCKIHPQIKIVFEDSAIQVSRINDEKKSKELHGLTRALINNIVTGLNDGFSKELNLVGVGYTVENKNDFLLLNLGFSHPIYFEKPEGIDFEIPNNTTVIVKGIDNQLVGDVAANIRKLRKPEPYKGKGVKYKDEHIRRKAGKTVGGAA
jgi:large subunit ribosomal protein L6|tara:strand:- start:1582 stop:2127 length:546 start_codon:yes stop_codon:yes gene_type:complete